MRVQEKHKKLIWLAGIVGVVYLAFRFLLQLFFPFLLAYVIAVVLRKPVRFLWKRLHIKPALGGAVLLVLFFVAAGGGIVYGIKLLLVEFVAFVGNYDSYAAEWDGYLESTCQYFDSVFRLDSGSTFSLLSDGLDGIVLFFKEELIPFLTKRSLKAAVSVTELAAALVLIFVAVLLFLGDMLGVPDERKTKGFVGQKAKVKAWKKPERTEKPGSGLLWEEWCEIKRELSDAGIAYVKTQVILITLVSVTCSLGLFLIKNPYALLFGVVIGILDAFPVLGSGLILVPWAVVCFLKGNAFAGAVLLTTYGICQFVREYLEPKLLGGKMGLRPVHSLMAVYIGYELFGFSGLLLGPFGLVLIKSIWRVSGQEESAGF